MNMTHSCYPGLLLFTSLLAANSAAFADQVPNPTVTASARAFNASFTAANLFDAGTAEYATASQGAVSAPFTVDPNNGTWAQFDFGSAVSFDRFIMVARLNAVDVIGTSRLIVSSDPTFDTNDIIFTFNPSGANGAGLIQYISGASGQYVRWEVLTRAGTGMNLGARHMYFLNTPSGHVLLPSPVVINSSTPFNATYAASQAANGNAGDGGGNEYASAGVGAAMFVDFDFTATLPISGFDYWNRPVDRVTSFDLIFANSPDFAAPIATRSFIAATNGNQVNSATFETVNARYVRFQATGATGGNNTGIRELQFYTPAGQPPFITQHPQSATRLVGDSVTFSVTAGGENPISYRWFRGTSPISNATNSTLTLTNLQLADAEVFRVEVINPNGNTPSLEATLTVVDPPLDVTSDLKLWLKLDDAIFLAAADSSGSGNDGVLQGFFDDDSQWVAGRIDGGLSYRPAGAGVNEVVTVPDHNGHLDFAANPEFTVAAWVRGNSQQEDGAGVIARGNGGGGEQYAVDISGGSYRFFVRSVSGAALVMPTPVRPNGTWQHLVAVYSRTLNRMKFYVNKSEVASATPFNGTLLTNQHEVSVGARQVSTTDYSLNFSGVLDDVRVYARALTPTDVAAIYDQAPVLPPVVVQQPLSTFAPIGGSGTFGVAVDGTVPLSYQWSKAGTIIPYGTNATLTITNAQAGDEADYRVSVTNLHGEAVSDSAHLTVVPFLNLSAAPAEASSLFNATFPATRAFDGLRFSTGPNTARWASAASGAPHWLVVDLGRDLRIRRVGLDWETAAGRDSTLRVRTGAQGMSTNANEWQTIAIVTGYAQTAQGVDGIDIFCDFVQEQIVMPGNINSTATTSIEANPITARYLMLHAMPSPGFGHVSVWELQVDAIDLRADVQSIVLDENGATLNFTGFIGSSYEVRRATSLQGPWSTLATISIPPAGSASYTDANPPQPTGFYQVVLP